MAHDVWDDESWNASSARLIELARNAGAPNRPQPAFRDRATRRRVRHVPEVSGWTHFKLERPSPAYWRVTFDHPPILVRHLGKRVVEAAPDVAS
jgi:hypothetical protein